MKRWPTRPVDYRAARASDELEPVAPIRRIDAWDRQTRAEWWAMSGAFALAAGLLLLWVWSVRA